MDKSVLIGVSVAVFVIGAASAYYLIFYANQKQDLVTAVYEKVQVPTPQKKLPSEIKKEYKDDAGFTFSYPDDVSIEKKESTDNVTYADIVFTSQKADGSISLKITDSKFKTIEEWKGTIGGESESAKVADLPAVKVIQDGFIITALLDKGVIFVFSMNSQKEKVYWENVYSTIVASFAFTSPESSSSSNAGSSVSLGDSPVGDIVEEEESIE